MSKNNISASCPISTKKIDANIVRLVSFQVALFVVLFLLTKEQWFAFVLLFDFAVRSLRLSKMSPFYLIAQFVVKGWSIAPRLCDESPKRFALFLGLLISFVLVMLIISGLTKIATVLAIVLLICALLETLFDFCIGCKLYYLIQISKGFFADDRHFK